MNLLILIWIWGVLLLLMASVTCVIVIFYWGQHRHVEQRTSFAPEMWLAAVDELNNIEGDLPEVVHKQFDWTFRVASDGPQEFTITIPIPVQAYLQAKGVPKLHESIWDYHHYARYISPETVYLAKRFETWARKHDHSDYEVVCNVLAFIQQAIIYRPDKNLETGRYTDYPQYPLETLMEGEGDCEDQAILAAALLKYMNFDVALLISPRHAALGVAGVPGLQGDAVPLAKTGQLYYYTETTAQDWQPGQVPSNFKNDFDRGRFKVLPVESALER